MFERTWTWQAAIVLSVTMIATLVISDKSYARDVFFVCQFNGFTAPVFVTVPEDAKPLTFCRRFSYAAGGSDIPFPVTDWSGVDKKTVISCIPKDTSMSPVLAVAVDPLFWSWPFRNSAPRPDASINLCNQEW